MFKPVRERIKILAETEKYKKRIKELERIFDKPTIVYIDFANVIYWQNRLGWHIDLTRLKQFLNSFDTIKEVKFYFGTLYGDPVSEGIIRKARKLGYIVSTKSVKRMKLPIDTTSIAINSPELLKQFIRPPLLQKLEIETIEYLNKQLKRLNDQGIFFLEDMKCNFDVEIGRDMLIDWAKDKVDNIILWSGDSDFADPIKHLLDEGKKVGLFITARKVAKELNDLKQEGLFIFEIKKIRDFICYKREIQKEPSLLKQKGPDESGP